MGAVRHTRSSLTYTLTYLLKMGAIGKFFILASLIFQYAWAQTTMMMTMSGAPANATGAPPTNSGSAWYDNPVTIAVVIIIFNLCMVAVAGPLLVSSYRRAQAQY